MQWRKEKRTRNALCAWDRYRCRTPSKSTGNILSQLLPTLSKQAV